MNPELFAEAVAEAVRAPSLHNSQPWRFRLADDGVAVLLDEDRVIRACDPTGRAARVSCGAAALNLRLALAVRGLPFTVLAAGGPVVARLVPLAPRPPSDRDVRLHAAIARRRSHRHRFDDTPVGAAARAELVAAALDEGGWLDLLDAGEQVEAVAQATREADLILSQDEAYTAATRAWLRSAESGDGIAPAAAGPAPGPYELLARRDFGGRQQPGIPDAAREPLVGVLGAAGGYAHDDVQAGLVLQRVLLTATDLGLATAMFSQPVEVPHVRVRIRDLLRRRHDPQMVLRFGYASPLGGTDRRPVEQVIDR